MEGAQFRDSRTPRFAVACALAVVAVLVVAPLAVAQSPAGDQYGSPLPTSGGDNGSSSSTPSSSSGDTGTVIPVAPSSDTSTTDSSSADTSSGGSGKNDSHDKQGAGHKANPKPVPEANLSGQPTSSHSIPQIAANSAGDSWVPFFIIGLVALASAFAVAVVLRNRHRRTAS